MGNAFTVLPHLQFNTIQSMVQDKFNKLSATDSGVSYMLLHIIMNPSFDSCLFANLNFSIYLHKIAPNVHYDYIKFYVPM